MKKSKSSFKRIISILLVGAALYTGISFLPNKNTVDVHEKQNTIIADSLIPPAKFVKLENGKYQIFGSDNLKSLYKPDMAESIDTRIKHLQLDVHIGKGPATDEYKKHRDVIFDLIKEGYLKHNVKLEINYTDSLHTDSLNPRERIGIFISDDKRFKEKYKVLEDKIASSEEFNSGIAYASTQKFTVLVRGHEHLHDGAHSPWKTDEAKNISRARTISHELGHILGLYHSESYSDDPIPDNLDDSSDVPNIMSRKLSNLNTSYPLGAGFNDFQSKQIHSFLSGGKAYHQMRCMNFNLDFQEYMVGLINGYHRPGQK